MHDDLHDAKAQRSHVAPDCFYPARCIFKILVQFGLSAHRVNNDLMCRYYRQVMVIVNEFLNFFIEFFEII